MRVDRVLTSGLFTLAPEPIPVENNIWLFGDDDRVIVIDAGHETDPIVAGISGREVQMIICTHGHNDHIDAAVALADTVGSPIALHPADRMLWDRVYHQRDPDIDLYDGFRREIGSGSLTVVHTPDTHPGVSA